MWNLKRNDTNELIYKTKTHRLREGTKSYWWGGGGAVQWEESRGGLVREFEIDMYTLLYLKWKTNKDLLFNTWKSAQCYVAI